MKFGPHPWTELLKCDPQLCQGWNLTLKGNAGTSFKVNDVHLCINITSNTNYIFQNHTQTNACFYHASASQQNTIIYFLVHQILFGCYARWHACFLSSVGVEMFGIWYLLYFRPENFHSNIGLPSHVGIIYLWFNNVFCEFICILNF